MRRAEGGSRTSRRWWLNPSLLVGGFVFVCMTAAIGGSIGDGATRASAKGYWDTFNELPVSAFEDAVIIGTWRGDVRFERRFGEPVHCGLRSYGLSGEARERFLSAVRSGEASGWALGAAEDAPPAFLSRDFAFCAASERLMLAMRERVAEAWQDAANPRFASGLLAGEVSIEGVYDRNSMQAYLWFTARPKPS